MEIKKVKIKIMKEEEPIQENGDVLEVSEEAFVNDEDTASVSEEVPESSEPSKDKVPLFPFRDNTLSLWEKIGKTCLYASLIVAPLFFLPLTASPVDTNKIILLSLLMLAGAGAFLGEIVRRRRVDYPRSFVVLAFLGFLLVLAVSAALSLSKPLSIYANLRNADSLLMMGVAGMGFLLSSMFLGARDRKPMGKLFIASTSLLTLVGIAELFGKALISSDAARSAAVTPAGTLSAWGTMVALGAIAAFFAAQNASSKKEKRILFVIALIHVAGLVLLNYPLHWLAVGITSLILAGLNFAEGRPVRSMVAVMIAGFLLFFAGNYIPSITQRSIEVRPNFQSSLQVAKSSIQGTRAFFGNGPSTFALIYSRFRSPESNQSVFWNVRFSDGYNAPVTLLVTGGVVGLLAFLIFLGGFFLFLLRGVFREDTPLAGAVVAGIVTWFFYPFSVAGLFIVCMGMGYMVSLAAPRGHIALEDVSRRKSFSFFAVVMVCAVLLTWTFYGVGRRYVAAVFSYRGTTLLTGGDVERGVANITRAASFDPASDEHAQLLSQAHVARARQLFSQGGLASAAGQSAVSAAVAEARRATTLNPRDPWNWGNAALIYENLIAVAAGADAASTQSYANAYQLEPQNPDYLIGQARVLLASLSQPGSTTDTQTQLLSRAEALLMQAISLKADYIPPHMLIAQIHIQRGDLSRATQQLEEVRAYYPNDPGLQFQLGALYYQNNKLDEAQRELERAIALSPDYSNARYFLGLIYSRRGLHAEAIEQFNRIAALNPDNETVKEILANLSAGRSALDGIGAPPAPALEKEPESPAEKSQQPKKTQ